MLLPVVLMISLIAVVAFTLNHQSVLDSGISVGHAEAERAEQVAQAGLQHATWGINNSGCAGNLTLASTPFGADSYDASVTSAATTNSYTLTVAQDAWLKESSPAENHGGDGEFSVKAASGDNMRALYQFDLSALPASASIGSATAWLYVTSNDDQDAVDIHEATAAWTEASADWTTMGGQFDTQIIASIPAQASSAVWVQVNLTGLVQAWVNGEPNNGIMLLANSDGVESKYASREWPTSSERPRLEVVATTGSASPVTISATGTLANGVTRTLGRVDVPAYQPFSNHVFQPGAARGKDAEIWDQAPNNNYGNAAETWVSSASNDTTRTLLRFNTGAIPAGARILEASLSLLRQSGSGADQPVSAHRIMNPWSEDSVTWNRRESGTNWDTAGGDFDNIAVVTTPVGPVNQRYEWNITPLVQGWVGGSYPNYGVALVAAIAGMAGERFYTSDHADPSRHPSLAITYTCECGITCQLPQGSGNLLFVVDDENNLTPDEQALQTTFEAWGYAVTPISDDKSQGNFNSGIELNDVVYISETASSGDVGTKLTLAPIGVVSEQGNLNDELGIAAAMATVVGDSVNVIDNSHYITLPFPGGTLPIYAAPMEGITVSGTEAPGLQTLADFGSAGSLVVLETGAAEYTGGGYGGSGTSAGRRVMLPLGRSTNSNFNWDYLNGNGRLIVQRALQWGTGNIGGAPPPGLLFVVGNDGGLTTEETAHQTLVESWGYVVELIDDDATQGEFDTAAAANDVVLITNDITASRLNTKLVNATIGVVTSEVNLSDEFGLSASVAWESGTQLEINDNTHYITSPFPTGLLTVLTASESLAYVSGTLSPALGKLASSTSGFGIVTLEAGATTHTGGTAAGRRAQLPWGGNGFTPNNLAADGKTILQRALEWGVGASGSGPAGPIAHWKLDDAVGPTAVDSEGTHDGTLTGVPAWTTGQLGGALDFDGVNDYVDVGTFDVSGSGLTMMGWFNADTIPTSDPRIISKSSGLNATDALWQLSTTDSGANRYLRMRIKAGGTTTTFADSSVNLATGQWYFAVATYDNASGAMKLYLDGVEVASGTHAVGGAVDTGPTVPVAIGANGTVERFFDGVLDDVRVYDRALSATEISDLFAAGSGGPYTVLMVVTDPGSLTPGAADRKALMESWGYTVNLIDDNDSQANFNTAIAAVDVVYVGAGSVGSNIGTKLDATTKGVVNEPASMFSILGFASSFTAVFGVDQMTIINSTHSITQGLASPVTVFTSPLTPAALSGTLSPDLQNLAEFTGASAPALAVLESGAATHDAGTTAGRRANLPFSTAGSGELTADGQLLVRRAIEWAAGSGGGGGGGGGPTIVEVRVATGNDDAEERVSNGNVNRTSSDLELISDGSNPQLVGMRFTGVGVPNGATITNAWIQFQVDETNTGATNVNIQGEASDSALQFTTTNSNISSRSRTTASIPWAPVAWTTVGEAGPDQRTPDISAAIQEIVSRPGWASGNDMVMIITGSGKRTAESYNGDASGAALLHIEY